MDNTIRVGTGVRCAKSEEHCDYATGFIWDEEDGLYSVCWMWAGNEGNEYPTNHSGAPGANIWSKEELQVMSQPDHDFVPFNQFAQKQAGHDHAYAYGCYEAFATEEEDQFLSWGRAHDIARFLLPTGCIQEIHKHNGESAVEAFRRWKKSSKEQLLQHLRVDGDFCLTCDPKKYVYCEKARELASLAGLVPESSVTFVL